MTIRHVLWLTILLPTLTWGAEDSRTVVIREQLNRAWHHERVEAELSFPKSGRVTVTGPNGVVAHQVIGWRAQKDGTQLLRLRWVVEALSPLAEQTYTVTSSDQPSDVAVPPTDLKLTLDKPQGEMTTRQFGIRVPLGRETFDPPVAADRVPGPLAGLRVGDGAWFGGSRLVSQTPVKEWSATILETGPVFARASVTYTFVDDLKLMISYELTAGDTCVYVREVTSGQAPDAGWQLLLGPTAKAADVTMIFGQRYLTKERQVALKPLGEQPALSLSSWVGDGWFPNYANAVRLPLTDREENLILSVHRVGEWVQPIPRPSWARFDQWDFPTIGQMWNGWQSKAIPLRDVEGGAALDCTTFSGYRYWSIGMTSDHEALLKRYRNETMSVQSPLPRLQDVREMVLEWPDGDEKHPYLMVDADQLPPLDEKTAATQLKRLRGTLDKLGCFDIFRYIQTAAADYDLLIDSSYVTPEERRLFKAQMAYLAYVNANPFHWSHERGYCSGNPNMTVARISNVGKMGLVLRDHPNSKAWVTYTQDWIRWWLDQVLDEDGGWPESSHYARVASAEMIHFALMSRRAGYTDFFQDPAFKRMGLFYEKTLTPRDPQRLIHPGNAGATESEPVRVGAPAGRGTRGDVWGLSGLWARATVETDPAYSAAMEWSWRESGYAYQVSHTVGDYDKAILQTKVPLNKPDWSSEYLQSLGYILRDRLGEADEDWLLFVSEYYQSPDGHIWPPDTGSIAKWFARGVPLGGNFRRIPEVTSVLLTNRVSLADSWDPETKEKVPNGYLTTPRHDGFSSLPGLDYVSVQFNVPEIKDHWLPGPQDALAFPPRKTTGKPPLTWQRQVLTDHLGQGLLLVRDTVSSESPTQWHFWFLSEKLGSPQEAADREAFLADKPGDKNLPARPLTGDRFSALGQFGLDAEIFVASPADTPRYTARYGTRGSAYGIRNFNEYQDLLQLQLEGPGSYVVAMVPRAPEEPMPTITKQADDRIIKVVSGERTSWAYLSDIHASVKTADLHVSGTAAMVVLEPERLTLSLAADGLVDAHGHSLASNDAAQLVVVPRAMTITLPTQADGGQVTLGAPGAWRLEPGQQGVALDTHQDGLTVTLTAGIARASLVSAD